jgi:hypothetical protein
LVKDWAAFARFLQLAAAQAGQMMNYAAVAREAGVSRVGPCVDPARAGAVISAQLPLARSKRDKLRHALQAFE